MPTPPGNYPPLVVGGVAVIPDAHQTLISGYRREHERGRIACGGPYPEWPYRGDIEIINPVATAGYQHVMTLSWVPGMNRDFSDIRFAQQDGTICPYWIKVPSASQNKIRVYFGNKSAISASSGIDTFILFDDFDDASLDTVVRWTNTYGGAVESGGALTITGANAFKGITSKGTFGTGYAFRCRGKIQYQTVNNAGFGFWGATTAYVGSNTTSLRSKTYKTASEDQTLSGIADNTFYVYEIQRNSTTNVKFLVDGTLKNTHSTQVPTAALGIQLISYQTGKTVVVDWCAIRLFTNTEPTLTLKQYGPRPGALINYYPFLPSPLTPLVTYLELIGSSNTEISALATLTFLFLLSGTSTTISQASATLAMLMDLVGTSETTSTAAAELKCFLAVDNEMWLDFDAGLVEIKVGDVIQGITSKARGTVRNVYLSAGDWSPQTTIACLDAKGLGLTLDPTGEDWETIRAESEATEAYPDSGEVLLYSHSVTDEWMDMARTPVPFDSSSLSGKTLVEVKLFLNITGLYDDLGAGEATITGGSVGNPANIEVTDFDGFNDTELTDDRIPSSEWPDDGGWISFTLNAAGIALVAAGSPVFFVRLGWDVDDTPPVWQESMGANLEFNSSGADRPYLRITYTEGGTPAEGKLILTDVVGTFQDNEDLEIL